MATRFALILLFVFTAKVFAMDGEAWPIFGAHPGYLSNVHEEKYRREVEMVMLPPPKETPKPLSKVIFNEKLSKEFQDQYRYRFGQTQAEQVTNNPGRDGDYLYYNSQSVTVQDYAKYQRKFGEYMVRRLTEYHFDNWFKHDRTLRPIYQAKDKFSNLDVKLKSGWKLKWKYNFSGPSMDFNLENPAKVEARVQVMMNGILSKPADTIYTFGYQLTPLVKVQALYRTEENLVQGVVSRSINRRLSTSFTASAGQLPGDPTIYQDLYLVGLSWTE